MSAMLLPTSRATSSAMSLGMNGRTSAVGSASTRSVPYAPNAPPMCAEATTCIGAAFPAPAETAETSSAMPSAKGAALSEPQVLLGASHTPAMQLRRVPQSECCVQARHVPETQTLFPPHDVPVG